MVMKRVFNFKLLNFNKCFKFFISYCIAVTLFAFNAKTQTIELSIVNDSILKDNEVIQVKLRNPEGDNSKKKVKVFSKVEPETNFSFLKSATFQNNSSVYILSIDDNPIDLVNNRYAFYFKIYTENDEFIDSTHIVSPIHLNLNVIPEADPTFSNPPELTFNKYWFEEVDLSEKTISIYRNIGDFQNYKKIKEIKVNSIEDLYFEDTTMNGVCGEDISYFVVSNTELSKSIKRNKSNYTENNKPENPKMLRLSVDDGMLVVNWEKSVSLDVDYYTISRKADGAYTWEEIISYIPNDSTSYIIDSAYCQNYSDFDYYNFKVFCVDSCGNESYKYAEDFMSPIKLTSVEYDNCNKLTFKWYDDYSLSDTKGYIINILNYANDTIFSEKVESTSLSSDLFLYDLNINDPNFVGTLNCNVSAYNDKGEIANSCFKEVVIENISEPPLYYEIVGIEYISEVTNKIDFVVDTTFDGTYSLYRLSSDTSNLDYVYLDDLDINELIYLDNNLENNKPYTYILKAKNNCDVYYPDSSYLQSIYLVGAFDEDEIQLCFSNMHSYTEEENFGNYFIIVDENTNNELNYFKGECITDFINDENNKDLIMHYCYDDIKETDFVKSFQIKYVNEVDLDDIEGEVILNNNIYNSYSNVINITLLEVDSIPMPNAIVLNANNPRNSKFGPMNFNQLLALEVINYNFQIFNSWGEMVWHSTDVNTKPFWEGKSDLDEYLPEGTYLYNITIEFPNNKIFNKKGTVSLFK